MNMKKALATVASVFILFPLVVFAAFDADLQYGSTGDAVTELQEFLTAQGHYTGPITGNFYSLTRRGVVNFQVANNISPAAGYFGPLTRAKVNAIFAEQGAASNAQAVQETGSAPSAPTKDDAVSLLQAQVNALLEQLKLLTAKVEAQTSVQQQTQNTLQQTQQSVQQIQQNTAPQPIPQPTPTPELIDKSELRVSLAQQFPPQSDAPFGAYWYKVEVLDKSGKNIPQAIYEVAVDGEKVRTGTKNELPVYSNVTNNITNENKEGYYGTFAFIPTKQGTQTLVFTFTGTVETNASPYIETPTTPKKAIPSDLKPLTKEMTVNIE